MLRQVFVIARGFYGSYAPQDNLKKCLVIARDVALYETETEQLFYIESAVWPSKKSTRY